MADRRCCRDATPASYIGVIFTMADEWKVAYGLSNAIFNDLETPPNPVFKVATFFYAEYLRNGTRYRHSFNGILIGTYTRQSTVSFRMILNDLT